MPADKGNVTVCINRDTYIDKANLLLCDSKTYKILRRDKNLLGSLQKSADGILCMWNNAG